MLTNTFEATVPGRQQRISLRESDEALPCRISSRTRLEVNTAFSFRPCTVMAPVKCRTMPRWGLELFIEGASFFSLVCGGIIDIRPRWCCCRAARSDQVITFTILLIGLTWTERVDLHSRRSSAWWMNRKAGRVLLKVTETMTIPTSVRV